jgi:hypothetical protein
MDASGEDDNQVARCGRLVSSIRRPPEQTAKIDMEGIHNSRLAVGLLATARAKDTDGPARRGKLMAAQLSSVGFGNAGNPVLRTRRRGPVNTPSAESTYQWLASCGCEANLPPLGQRSKPVSITSTIISERSSDRHMLRRARSGDAPELPGSDAALSKRGRWIQR